MIENLSALQVFVRVAKTQSFSQAARELNLSQPTISRTISILEDELGVSLLSRTTRLVSLTDVGADYLARIEPIIEAVSEANHAVRGDHELRGVLKLGLTSTFGNRAVIPRLGDFLARHKSVKIEIVMNDSGVDPVPPTVDLAFVPGELPDSTAAAARVASIQQVLAASPKHLKSIGPIDRPELLNGLPVIPGPRGLGSGWSFVKGNERVDVTPTASLQINVHEGAVSAAVAGLGIISTGICSVYPEFESGSLIRVLPDWLQTPIDVHAVYPPGRYVKPAARAFLTYLIEDFARTPIPFA